MKTEGMPIRDRSIKVLTERGTWEISRRVGLEKQTKRPNIRSSNQIQGFRPKQTQPCYLTCNLSVTAEIGPFSGKWGIHFIQVTPIGCGHERLDILAELTIDL